MSNYTLIGATLADGSKANIEVQDGVIVGLGDGVAPISV